MCELVPKPSPRGFHLPVATLGGSNIDPMLPSRDTHRVRKFGASLRNRYDAIQVYDRGLPQWVPLPPGV